MARANRTRVKRAAGGGSPRPRTFPLPGALDPGRDWTVREDKVGGSVMRGKGIGEMRVPLGQSDRDAAIRLHEMAHVKWTPTALVGAEGIPFETLNAVEDCRIHRRLTEAGFDISTPVLGDDFRPGFVKAAEGGRVTPLDAARLWMAAAGTGDERTVERALADAGFGWTMPVARMIHDRHLRPRRPAWRRTVECAAEIEDVFGSMPEDYAGPEGLPGWTNEDGFDRGDSGSWGSLTIERLPLTERMPAGMLAPRRRASDTGSVPRNWSRLTSDGRVFTRRRKRPGGGTVLIDQSGSMHLSGDEVLAAMALFPGVTIAGYAGQGRKGRLRILAENGKRTSDENIAHPFNGNIVDGPALEWLAGMPAPRVWICDGYVTGVGDSLFDNLTVEASIIQARAGITRIGDIRGLLDPDYSEEDYR